MPYPISQGVIQHKTIAGRVDYLYRVSLKCLIRNEEGKVLVVKEAGRNYWDLPGGGMDHSEDIPTAIRRELREEVNLEGDFTHNIIAVEEPAHLAGHNFWQIRLIFEVLPMNIPSQPGNDSDEIAFMPSDNFKNSRFNTERQIYNYTRLNKPSL